MTTYAVLSYYCHNVSCHKRTVIFSYLKQTEVVSERQLGKNGLLYILVGTDFAKSTIREIHIKKSGIRCSIRGICRF